MKSTNVLLLLFLASLCSAYNVPDTTQLPEVMEWEEWRELFEDGRVFEATGSVEQRQKKFRRNIRKIVAHNALNDAGLNTYRLGVNQFTDLSGKQFKAAVGLDKPAMTQDPKDRKDPPEFDEDAIPSSIDWRNYGAVTPVKNQASCGSCWSFATTGAIEGTVFRYTNRLVSLSEQELVDCNTRNHGCNGGFLNYAFSFVVSNGGLDSESDYPYYGRQYQCNRSKEQRKVASISGYQDVRRGSASALMSALATYPTAVVIEADQRVFQMYRSGVITGSGCGTRTDHAVLAVGYTATNDPRYPNAFIVKNSWGRTWGINGYVYISRSQQYSTYGVCGILSGPVYATGGSLPGTTPLPHPLPLDLPMNKTSANVSRKEARGIASVCRKKKKKSARTCRKKWEEAIGKCHALEAEAVVKKCVEGIHKKLKAAKIANRK